VEAGRPARRGDSSPAPFLRGGSKHPGSRSRRSLRGGRRRRESRSARGSTRRRVKGSPALRAPGPMTKGVRGLPRGGAPAVLHSLEEWARTGPSRRRKAVSRRPRPTSLAMMGRRVVARRRVVKKWWAPSTNAAHSGPVPGAPHPRRVVERARSDSESQRDPETRTTRKGRRRVARHAPDGDADRSGSPGGGDTYRRSANRATAPARERVRSSVGRARASYSVLQTSFSFVVAVRMPKGGSCG